jgi:bile acid:Na+ symporter, BASS family
MMEFTKLLISGANAAVVVFVVSSTLGVGLRLTISQILTPLRNGRLVALALLANFVLSPLAAIAIASVLQLDEPLSIGLLLCGVAAGAPFVLKLADMAKGNMPFAVGLMVVLMVTTVGYMPLVLPLLLAGVSVDAGKIAQSLIVLMLIPLAVGLAVRAWLETTAARLAPVVGSTSTLAMILVIVLTTAGHFPSVISVIGTFAILAAVVFTAVCLGIGWVLGGPAEDTRGVLGLGTAQRNTAAALVVAGQNFSDAKVVVMITVFMIVAFAMLVPLARFVARRADAAQLRVGATAGRRV